MAMAPMSHEVMAMPIFKFIITGETVHYCEARDHYDAEKYLRKHAKMTFTEDNGLLNYDKLNWDHYEEISHDDYIKILEIEKDEIDAKEAEYSRHEKDGFYYVNWKGPRPWERYNFHHNAYNEDAVLIDEGYTPYRMKRNANALEITTNLWKAIYKDREVENEETVEAVKAFFNSDAHSVLCDVLSDKHHADIVYMRNKFESLFNSLGWLRDERNNLTLSLQHANSHIKQLKNLLADKSTQEKTETENKFAETPAFVSNKKKWGEQ